MILNFFFLLGSYGENFLILGDFPSLSMFGIFFSIFISSVPITISWFYPTVVSKKYFHKSWMNISWNYKEILLIVLGTNFQICFLDAMRTFDEHASWHYIHSKNFMGRYMYVSSLHAFINSLNSLYLYGETT